MGQIGKGLGEVSQKAGDLIEPRRMQVQPAALRLSKRSDQMTPSLGLISTDLSLVSNLPEKKKARRLDVRIAQVAGTAS